MLDLNQHIFPKILLFPLVLFQYCLLRATRGARNPTLQAVTTHESHVCSQYSFGLLLRMNGMHRTQFHHARLDLLSLVTRSRVLAIRICHQSSHRGMAWIPSQKVDSLY